MQSKLKVLLIGHGSIGQKHAAALKTLKNYDVSLSLVSKKSGLTGFDKVYKSLEEVNLSEFGYFIIANITKAHFDTLSYINTRVDDKIILVEKPLFASYQDFEEGKNKIYLGYQLRFIPVVQEIKKYILDKKVFFAEFICHSFLPSWRVQDYREVYSAKSSKGGGVLLDLSHEIDLCLYLLGELNLSFARVLRLSDLEITSDDLAFLVYEKKDLVANITLDYFSRFEERLIKMHYFGGSLVANLREKTLSFYGKDEKKLNFGGDTISNLACMHEGVLQDKIACSLAEGKLIMKQIDLARSKA